MYRKSNKMLYICKPKEEVLRMTSHKLNITSR